MPISLRKSWFVFSEVAEILKDMFYVSDTKFETFKSRLQQLQKAGLPAGSNNGRGAKIRYQSWQIADLALMLELLDLGIPPGVLSNFYGSIEGREGRGIYAHSDNGWRVQKSLKPSEPDLYAVVVFDALKYLRINDTLVSDDQANQPAGAVFPDLVTAAELPEALDRIEKAGVVNMTSHLRRLREAVEGKYPDKLEDVTFQPTAKP